MNFINTENEFVKKIEPLLEQHYDELYALLRSCPTYSYFWDFVHIAFYKVAIKRGNYPSISAFARDLRMNRTTAVEIFKRFEFYEAKLTPTYDQINDHKRRHVGS